MKKDVISRDLISISLILLFSTLIINQSQEITETEYETIEYSELTHMELTKNIEINVPEKELESVDREIHVVSSASTEFHTEENTTTEEEYDSRDIDSVCAIGCFSETDIYYMQCCVETETYGADFNSKTHVASVILNRVYSDRFPNTPTWVVTAPNQFAYFRTNISQDTIDAVRYVVENGDTAQGGLFFHSGEYSEVFNGASYIFTDDCGHHIYK